MSGENEVEGIGKADIRDEVQVLTADTARKAIF